GQELFQLLPPPAARIGIQMGPVPEREAKAFGLAVGRGAVIKSVVAGSPAEAAGLRADDVITEVNGRPVDLKEGRPLLQNAPAGSIVEIRFLRDGQRLSTKATPELLQDDKASPVKVAIARFSPDGRWIVTADARVIMWDAETGAQIGTLYGHRSLIQRMEFCDGGTRLFTTAFDERPRVWDLSRMGELVSVDYTVLDKGVGTYGLMEATISRDCKFIATTSGGPTAVWNGQTGKLVRVLDNSYKVEFGPDSGVVATAGGWNATLWNTGSGEQVVLLFGHKADVLHATFSQSGRHLVTGSKDTTARVWDLRTGREVALLRGHDDRIEYAAFTHDGKTIVTLSDDKTARLWRFSGLEIPVANPTRHEFRPELEHLSQTGSRVVIPSRGDGVEVWHLDRAVPIVLQGHDGRAVHASISPDGRRVYTVTAHARRLWDADTGALIIQAERQESEPNVYMPRTDGVFSPDSRLVLTRSTDGQPELRNATTGESIELLQTPSHRPLATVFSEDGQRLATVGPGDVRVWSTKDGSPVAKLDMQRVENSFALSRNGSRLAVLVSGGVGLWDVDKAEQLATLTGHQRGIKRMVFSPNSRILVTVSEERARVWNANDGTLLFESTEVNPEISGGVAFSPDGSRLVIPGPKQTSHVVDPRTGDVVTVLEGHVAGASYVTFSRTGNRITTTSIDGTARLWDAETGVEFGKLGGENELTRQPNPFERKKSSSGFFPDLSFLEHAIVYAQFLPDGRRIFTVQASGDVRAFEVPETAELMALARKIARRALSDEERKQFFLAPAQGRTSERQSQKADQ
ncbi:MAG: WD40 repeat domain-containing protein, partial [Candidatus Methylomirabilaceae bacterium]